MVKNQVLSLRVAYYFIKKHDYRMTSFSQNGGEILLTNVSHPQYPMVRIDPLGIPISAQKIVELDLLVQKQLPFVRGQNGLLTIALTGEPESYDHHEVVLLTPEGFSSEKVEKVFKNFKIDWVINNEQADLQAIVSKLNQQSRQQVLGKSLWTSFRETKAVSTLVFIALAMYVLTILLNTLTSNHVNSLIILGGFYKPFVSANYEIWRFISAGFLHSDLFHLIANVLALHNIGMILEKIYGPKKIFTVVLTSIIVGHFFVFIGETAVLTIGLSGGVYGLFGLLIVYAFESGLIKNQRFSAQLFMILMVNLLINFMPNVSWLGHLGGFVAGVMLGLIYSRSKVWENLRNTARLAFLALVIMLSVLSVARPAKTEIYPGTDMQVVAFLNEQFNMTWYTRPLTERLIKLYESRGLGE